MTSWSKNYEKNIINEKYDYIEAIIEECLFNKAEKSAFTDKVDQIMTHPVWGIPVFLGIMALVFSLRLQWEIFEGIFRERPELVSASALTVLQGTCV